MRPGKMWLRKLITLATVCVLLLASGAVLLLRASPGARAASQPPHRGVSSSGGPIPPYCSPQVLSVYPSPNPSTGLSYLTGIAAAASNDIWAVGFTYDAASNTQPTLIEHFTGSAWTVVPSPSPAGYANYLTGISLLSSTNIWAVGDQQTTSFAPITSLVEHWDGSSWSVIPSANASGTVTNTYLQGVSALSATDIWAVGYSTDVTGNDTPIAEHWNGTAWSIVPTPSVVSGALDAVTALSSTDVWAVGTFASSASASSQPFIEHWNGTAWSVVPTPSVLTGNLFAVTALSSTDVWAVGFFVSSASASSQPFIEHWNGTAWSVVPSPNYPGVSGYYLNSIAAYSASDIWAVGEYDPKNTSTITSPISPTILTLALHWNGTAWSIVPSTSPEGSLPPPQDELAGVVALSPTQVWAVGYATGQNGPETLTEHAVKNPIDLQCPS